MWSLRLWALVALLVLAGCGGGGSQPASDDGGAQTTPSAPATGDLSACAGQVQDAGRNCYAREIAVIVDRAGGKPLPAVQQVAEASYAEKSGFLLANCHGIMHTVGREWAINHHLTLSHLMDFLPRSNDPGCSAGFGHGLVTGIAPQIQQLGAKAAAAQACGKAHTRYEAYSCIHGFGHAFMRINLEILPRALAMCEQLGADAPDCAQGAYHDYWFSLSGFDETKVARHPVKDPRKLCGAQPEKFVRSCWYRSFLEAGGGKRVQSPQELEQLCAGLSGIQHAGCVTGASLIGPADPRDQLSICSAVPVKDQLDCVRGTKVQNILSYPAALSIELVNNCGNLKAANACYRWLGRVIGVFSNGKFKQTGCPKLSTPAARKGCAQGVDSMDDGPLITFS
jgi:hypothetical protein